MDNHNREDHLEIFVTLHHKIIAIMKLPLINISDKNTIILIDKNNISVNFCFFEEKYDKIVNKLCQQ